jgi:hypothetical protein
MHKFVPLTFETDVALASQICECLCYASNIKLTRQVVLYDVLFLIPLEAAIISGSRLIALHLCFMQMKNDFLLIEVYFDCGVLQKLH